ncbi:GNAT family N-acetyltransferase [Methylolobus aquaticus]
MRSLEFVGRLPGGDSLQLTITGDDCQFRCGDAAGVQLLLRPLGSDAVALRLTQPPRFELVRSQVGLMLHALFEACPGLAEVRLDGPEWSGRLESLSQSGLIELPDASNAPAVARRALVRQLPRFWLTQPREPFPLAYTVTGGKRHPMRPPIPGGEVYRRHVPQLNSQLSFETVDPTRHLDAFHRWMNDPRVASFWELAGTREEHQAYLGKVLADRHMHPVVGCFDGHPFGYFEIYWAKEDRIAPYYAVDDYDRGIHMLVGEPAFRGPHRVAAWLPSLAHYLFLDDPRTRNVVAEPRADNAKMIGYLQRAGFYKEKEFDFPHKRAAMMILPREVFFDQFCI